MARSSLGELRELFRVELVGLTSAGRIVDVTQDTGPGGFTVGAFRRPSHDVVS